jgi:hypothetical protein
VGILKKIGWTILHFLVGFFGKDPGDLSLIPMTVIVLERKLGMLPNFIENVFVRCLKKANTCFWYCNLTFGVVSYDCWISDPWQTFRDCHFPR